MNDFLNSHINGLISNAMGLHGLNTSAKQVNSILNNSSLTTTRDEVILTCNLKKTFEYILINTNKNLSTVLLNNLHAMVGDDLISDAGMLKSSNLMQVNNLCAKLSMLNKMDDSIERAIESYLYVVRTDLFQNFNTVIGFLVMNNVLIKNGIGVLYVANVSDLLNLQDKEERLKEYLKDNIKYYGKM